MTNTATTTKSSFRVSTCGILGYLLIGAGLLALLTDVVAKSGQTILGLELVAVGTLLVATVLRRQALRRTT